MLKSWGLLNKFQYASDLKWAPLYTVQDAKQTALLPIYGVKLGSTFQLGQTEAKHTATSLALIVHMNLDEMFSKRWSIFFYLNGRQKI